MLGQFLCAGGLARDPGAVFYALGVMLRTPGAVFCDRVMLRTPEQFFVTGSCSGPRSSFL